MVECVLLGNIQRALETDARNDAEGINREGKAP